MMLRKIGFMFSVVLSFSVLTGWLNLGTTEVIVPMVCILLFSFIAGMLRPVGVWRWAALIALSVPLSYVIANTIHYPMAEAPSAAALDPRYLILLVPALIAAYAGVVINHSVQSVRNQFS